MRNNNNIGFYIGFSLFAIQTIAGDYYRSIKQTQHNNKMNAMLSKLTPLPSAKSAS